LIINMHVIKLTTEAMFAYLVVFLKTHAAADVRCVTH